MKLKAPFLRKTLFFISGMLCCVLLVEIGLRLGGLAFTYSQEFKNRAAIQKKGAYRIMCLGESNTALGGERSYPSQLEEILNQGNKKIKFSVINKGVATTNTSRILKSLESNLDAYRPDMVITMMGLQHSSYEAVSGSKVMNFLRSFRVYKLTRLLGLHIARRFKNLASAQEQESALSEESAELKKAIELNPGNDMAYARLGWFYQSQGKHSEAETLFKKALELHPENDSAYDGLKWFSRDQCKIADGRAEAALNKAIETDPKNDNAYIVLGHVYQRQGRSSEAEPLFKKAIELNPGNGDSYLELGYAYQNQGKFPEAESLFKKSLEVNPKNDRACSALKVFYGERGNSRLAEEYGKKVNKLNDYSPDVTDDYLKLKEILDKRAITYVCVQYPMRSLDSLKKIFEGNAERIIFVDNEKLFRDAVKEAGYKEYFIDMSGGDFGHCTPEGNRLLAENIADVISKAVFGE